MSDFTPIDDGGSVITIEGSGFGEGLFSAGPFGGGSSLTVRSLDTVWTNLETEIVSDFVNIGDGGVIIIGTGGGYGVGGYGEGGYGGQDVLIVGDTNTIWTNIDTP